MSKVDLRLRCGMPCSKLEVSTAQHGTLSGAGYLHQSHYGHMVPIRCSRAHARERERRGGGDVFRKDVERRPSRSAWRKAFQTVEWGAETKSRPKRGTAL